MTKPAFVSVADLRAFQRLANDAVVGLTDLVEGMHSTVARTTGIPGQARGRTRGITGFVYRSVRGVTRLVGGSVDALLGLMAPLIAERPSTQEREALLAALNGVLGDYLVASGSPLAITMSFRVNGVAIGLDHAGVASALPRTGRKMLVLMHGLCMNDLQWTRDGHDHGAALACDLGYTPVYLHYNSGRHISTNGRELADAMEKLFRAWPQPVDELAIVGHSMGGLLARSALHYAVLAGHDWPTRLRHLVFLGVPHLGAPLARAGTWTDFLLGISPYTAPFAGLGKVRSAGIKDLHHGNLRDEEWAEPSAARTSLPLPRGVRCYAVAASMQARPAASGIRIRGDGLVPVNSALGLDRDAARDLGIPASRRWVGYGMTHFDLLSRREVQARLQRWLASAAPSAKARSRGAA